jgi:GTPase SAR1 family protein
MNDNYKIMILGAAGTGKTAITAQLLYEKFIEEYSPTIEDYFCKYFLLFYS